MIAFPPFTGYRWLFHSKLGAVSDYPQLKTAVSRNSEAFLFLPASGPIFSCVLLRPNSPQGNQVLYSLFCSSHISLARTMWAFPLPCSLGNGLSPRTIWKIHQKSFSFVRALGPDDAYYFLWSPRGDLESIFYPL